jgi:DNA adenine methylase
MLLADVYERLQGVVIERLSYQRFIATYDRPFALFYLDPPYFRCERDYGEGLFGRDDFEQLAHILAGIKGRFILSLNDTDEVRHIFRGFDIEAADTTYRIAGLPTRGAELIITSRG